MALDIGNTPLLLEASRIDLFRHFILLTVLSGIK